MINQKINTITKLIDTCNVVIDVGCDHCLLAIELLKNNQAKHIINVDINQGPLDSGIKKLKTNHLFEQTTNIINDGLKNIEQKNAIFKQYDKIDYCVIAGMGSNNIIDIITNNTLQIDNFILQSSKDEYKLRKYLIKNNYCIIEELYVYDKNVYYPIFVVKKTSLKQNYKIEEIYYGKLDLIVNKDTYIDMLKAKQIFFEELFKKHDFQKINKALIQEYQILKNRLNYLINLH